MDKSFKVKSIKYNFLMNIILKLSGIIFPLITFPYISRVLLSTANGKIAFASSVVGYFSIMSSMGIPSYGIRKCAEVRDSKEKLSKVVTELLILNSVFTLLSYIVFAILLLTVPQFFNELLLFSVTSLTILFNMLGVEWFYQAIEQYQYITFRNIFFKIISIILMLIFIHQPEDYILYAGINVFASVGSNVLNVLRLSKYVDLGIKKEQNYNFLIHIVPIVTLFLYNATTVIFTSLDQVMLGFIKGNESVGYYAAAIKIQNILVSLVTALGAVMLPKISYTLKNGSRINFENMIRKSFEFIIVTAIPVCFLMTILSKDIILVLAGEDYLSAIPMLQYLLPSLIFVGLSSVTAWQLLIPLEKEKYTVIGALVGVMINLTFNFLLIPISGGEGAAVSSTLAEFAVLVVHFIALKDIIIRTLEFKEIVSSLLSTFVASSILIFVKFNIPLTTGLLTCIVYGMIFTIFYAFSLVIFREKLAMGIVNDLTYLIFKRRNK
ncbi:flippase [Streptococcus mitis]|uniref:Putative O-antigen transporter n=1 Tax=Streptococcus mitis TaxID=28037 RepID=A0A428D648_STRMT|nr:flippase [Streptococcus mitis]RSI87584.1 putative O-antigen transporter [Streptococcus mitis]